MKINASRGYNTAAAIIGYVRKQKVILLVLSAMIVFITSYMLILPALTLDEEEAAKQGGIDLQTEEPMAEETQEAEPAEEVQEAAAVAGALSFEGDNYSIRTVFDQDAGLPENTQLAADEIADSDESYNAWCDEALKALQEADGGEQIESLAFARFYDISLIADEQPIEPAAAVNVSISYKRAIPVSDESHLRIVHFAVDEEDGSLQPEVLDEETVALSMKKGKLQEAAFEAESFSVYGIVYTVDFHHEADGQTYEYSIEGESVISLKDLVKELHVAEDADSFMNDVSDVQFTDPDLLRVCFVEEEMTLWDVKLTNHFLQPSDLWRSESQVRRNNERKMQAGDWALISMQPFNTEETLTITMNNGDRVELKVTDAQNAPMKDDGVTVDTITNPAGTTIDVFDYWVDDDLKDAFARLAWPGFDKPGTDANLKWDQPLRGTGGNNAGINASTEDTAHGHALKFSPAFSHTVYDGTVNNWSQETSDNYGGATPTTGLNSYTLNADPRQGIVTIVLVGGESNLYIHYNLVSTADFTGHKAYTGGGADQILTRDQFQFEMIGLDEEREAIMPVGGDENGAGTVADPKKVHTEKAWGSEESGYVAGTVYTTGVTEDGNINFGTAEISQEEMRNCDQGHPATYRYIIREVIPGDAINEEGVRWDQATEEQKKAGGFAKDQVVYDSTVYYMTGSVTSWDQTGSDGKTYKHYGLSKTYYTDDTFTTKADDVNFIDFRNTYQPAFGDLEFDKVDPAGRPVPGAHFTLFMGKGCKETAKDADGQDLTAVSDADGKVRFENVPAGTYCMKETLAPNGYTANDAVYKVVITDRRDKTRASSIVCLGDETESPVTKIVNTRPGELSVVKQWVDENGSEVDGGNDTATVQLRRYHYEAQESASEEHNVTVRLNAPVNYSGQTKTTSKTWTINGDTAVITWKLSGGADKDVFAGYDSFRYSDGPEWSVTRKSISSDITVDVTLKKDQYWIVQNFGFSIADIKVEGSSQSETIPDELVPDANFPADADDEATQLLSASNGWAHTWTIGDEEDCDFPATDGRKKYLYYAVELDENGNVVSEGSEVSEGIKLLGIDYDPQRIEDAGITEGLITVTNQLDHPEQEFGYELPAAGGSGTHWIYLLGAALLLGCGITLIARGRSMIGF